MFDVLCPAHLAYVDETLDTLLDLDEGTVVGHRNDLTLNAIIELITILDLCPWMRRELLHAERDTLLVLVEIKNDDRNGLIELDDLRRMRYTAP